MAKSLFRILQYVPLFCSVTREIVPLLFGGDIGTDTACAGCMLDGWTCGLKANNADTPIHF